MPHLAFRPCYIRAFSDAKDYKKDDGKVIEGTKNATNDDFVSKGEFKYLNSYLCIYGAMFGGTLACAFICNICSNSRSIILHMYHRRKPSHLDAFAKVDGGGAGRDANDDKRIEEKEWMEG